MSKTKENKTAKTTDKNTEAETKVTKLTHSKMEAINAQGLELAKAKAKDMGAKVEHDIEKYSEARIKHALNQLVVEEGKLERASKYLAQGVEGAKKCKEWQLENLFHNQNFQRQSRLRIEMANLKIEECMAVLTGQEPVDNSVPYIEVELKLWTEQVYYKAARPETSTAQKVNLKNLEKKRAKLVATVQVECAPFAEERDGEWVLTAQRQKEQPLVENAPKPEPKKEEKAEEKVEDKS